MSRFAGKEGDCEGLTGTAPALIICEKPNLTAVPHVPAVHPKMHPKAIGDGFRNNRGYGYLGAESAEGTEKKIDIFPCTASIAKMRFLKLYQQ